MKIQNVIIGTAIVLIAAAAQAGRDVTHSFNVSQPGGGILRLVVDIPVGDVTVTNGTGNEIRVSGTAKMEYGGTDDIAAAQKIVDAVTMRIHTVGSRAILQPKYGPAADTWRHRRKVALSVRIELPPGTNLDISQKVGDINVDGNFGDIDIRSRVGDINVKTPKQNVKELTAGTKVGDVSTNLGDRLITTEGVFAGKTHFFNDRGRSTLKVSLRVGDIDIKLE